MISNAELNRVGFEQDQWERDEAMNAAVKGLGKRLYGDEKNLWTEFGDVDPVKGQSHSIPSIYLR
jgi:hypothetical protein